MNLLEIFSKPSGRKLPVWVKVWRSLLVVLVLGGAMQGCNLFKGGSKAGDPELTVAAQATATRIAQLAQGTLNVLGTQTVEAITPSPTLLAPSPFPTLTATPTVVTPTATQTVTPTATSAAQLSYTPVVYFDQIKFSQGGTAAYVAKSINSGQEHRYSVRAVEGQTLIVNVSSENDDVYLDVKGLQDGQHLLWAGGQAQYWSGRLPKTQDYLITLRTSSADTSYFLSIEVPANIYFDIGAYSDFIEGYIEVNADFHPDVLTRVRYLAYAFAGQKMTYVLSSPNLEDLSMGIVGQTDGQTYIRYEVKNSEGTITLPTTQGYYLDVYAVSGESTDFSLKLTIK